MSMSKERRREGERTKAEGGRGRERERKDKGWLLKKDRIRLCFHLIVIYFRDYIRKRIHLATY